MLRPKQYIYLQNVYKSAPANLHRKFWLLYYLYECLAHRDKNELENAFKNLNIKQ